MNRWAHVSRRLVFFRLSAETSQYNPNKTQSALIHSRGEEESMGELLHQLLDERTRHIRRHLQIAMDQRAAVQDRLSAMQRGNVGALEEFPMGISSPQSRDFSMAAIQLAGSCAESSSSFFTRGRNH